MPPTEREQRLKERLEATDKLNNPGNLHLKYAQWREDVGDLADARKFYQFAMKENPKSLEAKLGLARMDQLAGLDAEAEAEFQEALKSRPDDPLALNALGQFYASQKQWGRALPLLEKAAEAAPTETTFRYHYAIALAQSGDMSAAFPHFRQVLGEAEAHYNIGYLLYEQGQTAMAKARIEKALSIKPELQQAQDLLAEIQGGTQGRELAQAPRPFLSARPNPIRQASAAQIAPARSHVRLAHASSPAPVMSPVRKPVETAAPVPLSRPAPLPAYQPAPVPAAPTYQATPVPTAPTYQATPVPTAQNAIEPPVVSDVPATPPAAEIKSSEPPEAAALPTPKTEPPAFHAAPQQGWKASKPTEEPGDDFLSPEQSQFQSAEATSAAPATSAAGPVLTPPITPAQREQWENQMKLSTPE